MMTTYNWQQIEKGEVCQAFAKLVESWDYSEVIECLSYENSGILAIYRMSADGVEFSFHKVGDKYLIQYLGEGEFIQKETFDMFEAICRTFYNRNVRKRAPLRSGRASPLFSISY